MRTDGRFCYGANCTWFGSIYDVGSQKIETCKVGHRLPCCPLCGGMLFELPDQVNWWQGIDNYERGDYPVPDARPHPGYRAMWEWQKTQKKCFRGLDKLVAAYKEATGITVNVEG